MNLLILSMQRREEGEGLISIRGVRDLWNLTGRRGTDLVKSIKPIVGRNNEDY